MALVVVRGVNVKYISLVDTALKFCRLFLCLPMNIETPGDTPLEVTVPLCSFRSSFFREYRGGLKEGGGGKEMLETKVVELSITWKMVYHLLTRLKI